MNPSKPKFYPDELGVKRHHNVCAYPKSYKVTHFRR